jgi:hypothetical protein
MNKLRDSTNEAAFHLCDGIANITLLFFKREELPFYGFVKLAQITSADRTTNGDKDLLVSST